MPFKLGYKEGRSYRTKAGRTLYLSRYLDGVADVWEVVTGGERVFLATMDAPALTMVLERC